MKNSLTKTLDNLDAAIQSHEVIIWDFDGTIGTLKVDWRSLKNALHEYANQHTSENLIFTPLNQTLISFCKRHPDKTRAVYDIIEKYELAYPEEFSVNTQLTSLIEKWWKEKKFAIFSSNMLKTILFFLKNIDHEDKFPIIISRDSILDSKPHPGGLYKILNFYNVTRDAALLIGNDHNDLESGKRASIETLII